MLAAEVLERSELSHIKYNYKENFYYPEQLHLSLVNSSWGMKQLQEAWGRREFYGKSILDEHADFKFDPVPAATVELSTRFHYDPDTGMYLSAYTIKI